MVLMAVVEAVLVVLVNVVSCGVTERSTAAIEMMVQQRTKLIKSRRNSGVRGGKWVERIMLSNAGAKLAQGMAEEAN
jgi:hypothetical protein